MPSASSDKPGEGTLDPGSRYSNALILAYIFHVVRLSTERMHILQICKGLFCRPSRFWPFPANWTLLDSTAQYSHKGQCRSHRAHSREPHSHLFDFFSLLKFYAFPERECVYKL